MRGEAYRIRERAATSTGHHARRVEPRCDQRVEQFHALADGLRICFTIGAKRREPHVLGQQPAAVRDKALGVRT